MISMHPAYSVGLVDQDWIDRVETHQKKKLVSLGDFSLEYLAEMVDMLSSETSGEIELLVSAENIMPDKTRAGLFVAKYDGKNYVALAGISHGSGVDTATDSPEYLRTCMEEKEFHTFGCLGEHERRITELEECTYPGMAKDIGDLTLRMDQIERDHKDLKTEYHIINKVLDDQEKEVKDQREDYHTHIQQFVEKNVVAHGEIYKILKALQEKKAENHTETVCPECGSGQLVHDYERAELVCQSCGLVIDDDFINRQSERD